MLQTLVETQTEEHANAGAFRIEVRKDVKELKDTVAQVQANISQDYVAKKDVSNIVKFIRWAIATGIGIGGLILLYIHKGKV